MSHLDSVSSVFLLDYGSHALALDCDPGLTLDSVYISCGQNVGQNIDVFTKNLKKHNQALTNLLVMASVLKKKCLAPPRGCGKSQ